MALRVIQFSTGNVGRHALRQLVEQSDFELVGVHAASPAKVGRDAAELCGREQPTGVLATDDLDALVADVVGYVRTHFGNSYFDPVSAADVAAARSRAVNPVK